MDHKDLEGGASDFGIGAETKPKQLMVTESKKVRIREKCKNKVMNNLMVKNKMQNLNFVLCI